MVFYLGKYYPSRFYINLNQDFINIGDLNYYTNHTFLKDNFLKNEQTEPNDFIGSLYGDNHFQEQNCSDQVKAINTVYHEMTHYKQDFLLGYMFNADYIEDEILEQIFSYLAFQKFQKQTAIFPITKLPDTNRYVKLHRILDKKKILDTVQISNLNTELTAIELCEGSAAATAYLQTKYLVKNNKQAQKEHDKIFYISKMDLLYHKAWDIYLKYLNISDSTLPVNDALIQIFVLICDISLHTPTVHLFQNVNENDLARQLSPSYRFISILNNLTIVIDKFNKKCSYDIIYNEIAQVLGWKTFELLYDEYSYFYYFRMQKAFMVSDWYKYNATYYKYKYSQNAYIDYPKDFLHKLYMPVFVLYKSEDVSKLTYDTNAGGWNIRQTELLPNTYTIMKEFHNQFTLDMFKNKEQANSYAFELPITFLREILCRIIARSFSNAALSEECYKCPLTDLNCPCKKEFCNKLTHFRNLPEQCSLRLWFDDYKIDYFYIIWDKINSIVN